MRGKFVSGVAVAFVFACGLSLWAFANGPTALRDAPVVTTTAEVVEPTVTAVVIPSETATPLPTMEPEDAIAQLATVAPSATAAPLGYVDAGMYGEAWAFTVDAGLIRCDGEQRVVMDVDGATYAINGAALSWLDARGYVDVREIWRDNPDEALREFVPKVDVSPFIALGLALCEGAPTPTVAAASDGGVRCVCDRGDLYSCASFASVAEAQACLELCADDPHKLDGDADGLACE